MRPWFQIRRKWARFAGAQALAFLFLIQGMAVGVAFDAAASMPAAGLTERGDCGSGHHDDRPLSDHCGKACCLFCASAQNAPSRTESFEGRLLKEPPAKKAPPHYKLADYFPSSLSHSPSRSPRGPPLFS
jgi:hypothetical protein